MDPYWYYIDNEEFYDYDSDDEENNFGRDYDETYYYYDSEDE